MTGFATKPNALKTQCTRVILFSMAGTAAISMQSLLVTSHKHRSGSEYTTSGQKQGHLQPGGEAEQQRSHKCRVLRKSGQGMHYLVTHDSIVPTAARGDAGE